MALIDDVPTCKVLIEVVVRDAEAIICSRLPAFIGGAGARL